MTRSGFQRTATWKLLTPSVRGSTLRLNSDKEYRGTPLGPSREQRSSQTPDGALLGSHFSGRLSLAHLPPGHLPAPDHHCGPPGRSVLGGTVSEQGLKGCKRIAGTVSTDLMPVDIGFHQRLLTKWARCLKKRGRKREPVLSLMHIVNSLF